MSDLIGIVQGNRWISVRLFEPTYQTVSGVPMGNWKVMASSRSPYGGARELLTSANPDGFVWLNYGTTLILAHSASEPDDQFTAGKTISTIVFLKDAMSIGSGSFKPISRSNAGDGRLFASAGFLNAGSVTWGEQKTDNRGMRSTDRSPPSRG